MLRFIDRVTSMLNVLVSSTQSCRRTPADNRPAGTGVRKGCDSTRFIGITGWDY